MPLSRRTRSLLPVAFLLGVLLLGWLVLVAATSVRLPVPGSDARPQTGLDAAWPSAGQAAVSVSSRDDVVVSDQQQPVPIASVTKIMTALLVLEQAPLAAGEDGWTAVVTAADADDTRRRRARSESVVDLHRGDRLTERTALLALLLPSAGNVAHLLAARTAGSEPAFVALMNARAKSLGMTRTHYADASGFDPASRSTARDQTVLARTALEDPTFAWLVAQPVVVLPTAGPQATTNRLLGHRGFVGVKTGSTSAAGGCFVFAAHREVDGAPQLVVGAVLGQRGPDPLRAAFAASERLVDAVSDG